MKVLILVLITIMFYVAQNGHRSLFRNQAHIYITRKRFSEKPIVAFTNTRLIYNYIAHIIKYQEAQTIPDCIRYITCVFCYNFKSQSNILASY